MKRPLITDSMGNSAGTPLKGNAHALAAPHGAAAHACVRRSPTAPPSGHACITCALPLSARVRVRVRVRLQPLVSTWKPSHTRTSSFKCGTWVARRASGHTGEAMQPALAVTCGVRTCACTTTKMAFRMLLHVLASMNAEGGWPRRGAQSARNAEASMGSVLWLTPAQPGVRLLFAPRCSDAS